MDKSKTKEELQRSYDIIWSDFILKEDYNYYLWIADLLDIKENKRFLDVACGAGFMLKAAFEKGAETYGVDISPIAISRAKEISPGSKIEVGDGENLPFDDDSFDYVSCLGSLEHYLHPDKGILEISRVMGRDGKACIVLPNKWYWHDFVNGVLFGWDSSHGQEIERFYSRKTAEQLLEENGLKVRKVLGYNKKIGLGRLKPIVFVYNKLLYRMVPINASYHFVFICKRSDGQ